MKTDRFVTNCLLGLLSFFVIESRHSSAETVFDNLTTPVIGSFFGGDAAEQRLSQQFLLGDNNTVTGVTVELYRIGSPSGRIDVEIWNDSGAETSGALVGAVGSIGTVRSVPSSPTLLTFETPLEGLTPGAPYYVVLSFLKASGTLSDNISWNVVESPTGTNGTQQAQATSPGTTDWVRIVDIPPAPPVSGAYYRMSVIAAAPGVVPGDYDGNRVLDVADIDALTAAVRTGANPSKFDLYGDSLVNQEDRRVWVSDLKKTWFGDSNLDGQFQTRDFINVFTAGEYEDELDGNSTWFTGDWNGDREFDSGDMVTAFQDGGWERGPRVAVNAVPEPSCLTLATLGIVAFVGRRRF